MIAILAGASLIGVGVFGILSRRDVIAVLAATEVAMAGVLVLMAATTSVVAGAVGALSEARLVLILVLAAAEAAVGLALAVAVAARTGVLRFDDMRQGRG